MSNLLLYEERWRALDAHMERLRARLAQSGDLPRKPLLEQLLKALSAFGAAHFRYFYDGFRDGGNGFITSEGRPPEYALRVVIDRVTDDLLALERCLLSRRDANADDAAALLAADVLALEALRPAQALGWLPNDANAITYSGKTASIRIIPYAAVALVGIPFSAHRIDVDAMAIPHEIGHYVYWNGTIGAITVREALDIELQGEPAWVSRWQEELFADMYGVAVTGERSAYSFLALEREARSSDYVTDDGDHPPPMLRSEYYAMLLELRNPQAGARFRAAMDAQHATRPEVRAIALREGGESDPRDAVSGPGSASCAVSP